MRLKRIIGLSIVGLVFTSCNSDYNALLPSPSVGVSIPLKLPDFFYYGEIQEEADKVLDYIDDKDFRFNFGWCSVKFNNAQKEGKTLIIDECKDAYNIAKEECFYNNNLKYCPLLSELSGTFFKNTKINKRIKSIYTKSKYNSKKYKILEVDNLLYQNENFENTYFARIGNWQSAKKYCSKLTLGNYTNWRLATEKELLKLANIKLFNLTKNSEDWRKWYKANKYKRNMNIYGSLYFLKQDFIDNMRYFIKNNKSSGSPLWTSTEKINLAKQVDFYYGDIAFRNKSKQGFALCVHDKL